VKNALKQIWYDSLPFGWVSFEGIPVPDMTVIPGHKLVNEDEREQGQQHGVLEVGDDVHGEVDADLHGVVGTGDELKQAAVGDVVTRVVHGTWSTHKGMVVAVVLFCVKY